MEDRAHIVKLEIRNFQRIRAGVWDLTPGLQRLTSGGRNKQGKTSVLRAIRTLFEGAGAVPPVPVNTEADLSEDEAVVRAWLSDGWTIRRSFTDRGSYLHVTGPDGGKHGQTRIDAWTEGAAFNPLSFFGLRASEQAEVLLGLASDPDLGEKLEANADRDEELREERRPHNSEIQRLRKVRQRKLAQAREALQKREHDRDVLEQKWDEAQARAEEFPDPADEMDEVRARIDQADVVHEALEPWKEWERAQVLLETNEKVAAKLTEKIQANARARDELIASAEFPIPGLDFTPEGEVTLNGLPLEQASGRERVELAAMAAVAANPRLRTILVDEGNDLDAEGLEHLADLAEEHGLQVIVARLGLEGAGELEVVNGFGPVPDEEDS